MNDRIGRMLIAVLVLFMAGWNHSVLAADDGEPIAKVVYHVDFSDPKRVSAMIQNIFNMTTTYENEFIEYDIRVVFLSKGIRFITRDDLKGSPFEADDALKKVREDLITRFNSLHTMRGVKFNLCNITRELIGLDEDKLIPGVSLVTSGVVEIARLQSEGFSYLKVE